MQGSDPQVPAITAGVPAVEAEAVPPAMAGEEGIRDQPLPAETGQQEVLPVEPEVVELEAGMPTGEATEAPVGEAAVVVHR